MTINISLPEGNSNLRPRITVVGIGGAGGNAVNNMINSNLEGVDFLVANTDAQALSNSSCERKIQLGIQNTKGLGAGMRPDIGKTAAEESLKDIESKLNESNMAFIAAGMGGGTGTGAAPVIAKIARENGILTVGVVTKPFHFEGIQRMRLAEKGIEDLKQFVDTLLIIPNQNLFRIANEKTTFSDAFKMADDVLYAGVRGVTDLMVMPGLINLDFSDIRTVMSEMGKAMMGTGEAQGENRAVAAAEAAIASPLIDDVSLKGAKGLIINITGGKDLTLYEVDEAANRVREEVDVDANIIFGSTCDNRLEGLMRVSIVATGIEGERVVKQNTKEKLGINIDNSVYYKPQQQAATTQNYENPISNGNMPNNEIVPNSKDEISDNKNVVNGESELAGANNPEKTHINQDHDRLFQLEENKVEDEVLNQNQDLNEENKEKSTVRRISLFDNYSEKSSESETHQVKKEPVLINSNINQEEVEETGLLKEESEEIIGQNLENDQDLQENENIDFDNENLNQEEELLDIPTFLRRQAN